MSHSARRTSLPQPAARAITNGLALEPCKAQDFTLEGLEWQGATGSLIGRMTFARKPGHDCRLDPMVRARILWSNGLLAVPVRLVDRLAGDPASQA